MQDRISSCKMTSISVVVVLWSGLVCGVMATQSTSTTGTSQMSLGLGTLLRDLHVLSHNLETMHRTMTGCRSDPELVAVKRLLAMEARLEALETQQKATDTLLQSTPAGLRSRMTGSTFVRWGRKTCTNSSQLVYSGIAGGSRYSHTGAAADPLCLTMTPQFDDTPIPPARSEVYGAEYQQVPNHHDHDVPCSVCRAPQSTTITVPGTHTCPTGWTAQYSGHLAAGRNSHKAASQYACLDREPENVIGGQANRDGYLFYYSVTSCGSLPCPPYRNNKVVLCVVCSK